MKENGLMNLPVLSRSEFVGSGSCIGLRALCEMLEHHMLNIFCLYIFEDVWRLEILPNCHVISAK
jgi:hypothetical protein